MVVGAREPSLACLQLSSCRDFVLEKVDVNLREIIRDRREKGGGGGKSATSALLKLSLLMQQ
eukprot:642524-Hanusia_phi.AAC.1